MGAPALPVPEDTLVRGGNTRPLSHALRTRIEQAACRLDAILDAVEHQLALGRVAQVGFAFVADRLALEPQDRWACDLLLRCLTVPEASALNLRL